MTLYCYVQKGMKGCAPLFLGKYMQMLTVRDLIDRFMKVKDIELHKQVLKVA